MYNTNPPSMRYRTVQLYLQQFDSQVPSDDSELLHLAVPVLLAEIGLGELALQRLRQPQHAGVLVQKLLEVADEIEVQSPICQE